MDDSIRKYHVTTPTPSGVTLTLPPENYVGITVSNATYLVTRREAANYLAYARRMGYPINRA